MKRTPTEGSPVHVVWVGYVQSDDDFNRINERDGLYAAVSTHRFGWSTVQALLRANVTVSAVSSPLVMGYPKNKLIFRRRSQNVDNVDIESFGFVNYRLVKQATRVITGTAALRRALRHKPIDVIMVHGSDPSLLALGAWAQKHHGIPAVAVITDPPTSFYPNQHQSQIRAALKHANDHLTSALLHSVSATVALTEELATRFLPGAPYVVLEGICPTAWAEAEPPPLTAHADRPLRVVYAGGLRTEYGVANLVDAVGKLCAAGGAFELHLYGGGPLAEHLAASPQPGVFLHGMLQDPADIIAAMHSADILVNPRPPDGAFVPFSFPSKLLEYLSAGRPVVSTRLPGIPNEYGPHLLWAGDGSPTELAQALDSVRQMSAEERANMGSGGRRFAVHEKGVDAAGAKLREFLRSLQHS